MARNTETSSNNYFTDKDWIRSIFAINQKEFDGGDWMMRTWSTSDTKFQDTALGGSLVINPLPQPNIFTDPVSTTHWLKASGTNSDALSPYFSEAFDDNYRYVTMRFGTMAFTSLLGFLLNMYHPAAGALANKGLIHTVIFKFGQLMGNAVSLITWPLRLTAMVAKGINFFMRKPLSRYAYVKPNMPMYWSSVQTIANHFMNDLNLVFRRTDAFQDINKDIMQYSDYERQAMKDMWPNLHGTNGFFEEVLTAGGDMTQVDVFKVATRAQRLANARQELLERINERTGEHINIRKLLQQAYREGQSGSRMTMAQYLKSWHEQGASMYNAEYTSGQQQSQQASAQDGSSQMLEAISGQPQGVMGTGGKDGVDLADAPDGQRVDNQGFKQFLEAEARDGGQFITFRVDDTGSVSETFSNSYKASALAEKINSMSSTSRDTMFNMAGGNIGDDVISNLAETAIGGIKSMAEGVIAGIGLEGLLVGGGGTVSMPKYWESSEVNLAKPGYSFTLRARYANRRSAFMDVYFPLACILAAAMPSSVGKHSHTAPLYFEFYDKGRAQSRLAAIESLTITRGDGNMGFTPEGHLMSVKVDFQIAYMEETLAAPITEAYKLEDNVLSTAAGFMLGGPMGALAGYTVSFGSQLTRGLFDDDTPFMDYMATLAGLGVNEQHYFGAKLKRRFNFNRMQIAAANSTAKKAAFIMDSMPGQLIAALAMGTKTQEKFFWDEHVPR